MKYKGLDGRYYTISVADYTVYEDATKAKSSLHLRARTILKGMFPVDRILEEVNVRVGGSTLYADFLLPSQNIVVEVQGEQHYTFTKFFHGDKMGFLRAKARDREKREWCDMNALTLLELPYNESDEQWRERIEQRLC